MSSPYTSYNALSPNPSATHAPTPEMSINGAIGTSRGRARGGLSGTGAKRGRKPRGGTPVGSGSPRIPQNTAGGTPTPSFTNQQYSHVHWALPSGSSTQANNSIATSGVDGSGSTPQGNTAANAITLSNAEQQYQPQSALQPQTQQQQPHAVSFPGQQSTPALPASNSTTGYSMPSTIPTLDTTGLISFASTNLPPVLPIANPVPLPRPPFRPIGVDDDGEGEDELLPAMADDDYSAQLSWQSQSKDNLKVLMDNFSPAQYDRFEAYRRHALPKQAVRKVIQQTLGQQVSQPVAQIVAGFGKVFVGEIVEKARAVQTRRGDLGPLSPDHLREAYRMYQAETGRVGAARPLRSKRLFVR